MNPTKGLSLCAYQCSLNEAQCVIWLPLELVCWQDRVLSWHKPLALQTCPDNPGPALFLFLPTVLFVQQLWTETELTLAFLNFQQSKHAHE